MKHLALFLFCCCYSGVSLAQSPAAMIDAVRQINRQALDAQKSIDQLHDERQRILSRINTIEQDGSAFAVRNIELNNLIDKSRRETAEVDEEIQAVNEIQTGIAELMRSMIATLEKYIDLDFPFQLAQRRAVIDRLNSLLERDDISVAQKYQAVVSAYLDELRFGFSNEVYKDRIDTPGGQRVVEILRLGRAGLWYLTADGALAGYYDLRRRSWVDRNTDPAQVRLGIRMIRDSLPPTAIDLPVVLSSP